MGSNIVVNRGYKEAVEAIFEIEKNSFENPWSIESILEDISFEDRSFYFLISENNNIIGYTSIWIIENEVSINNIAILKKHRGKGYGKILINKIFEIGKEKEVERYILEVRESNLVAIRLYEKMGFKVVGKRKQFYSDGEAAFVMLKQE